MINAQYVPVLYVFWQLNQSCPFQQDALAGIQPINQFPQVPSTLLVRQAGFRRTTTV